MSRLTLDWIQVLALLGAVQGVFLAGVLVARRRNRTANRVLAALMASVTVYLLQDVYYTAGLVGRYPQAFGVSYPVPWLFGPLVYLYTRCASDRARRLRRRDWLHFLPAVVVVLVTAPIYGMDGAAKEALFQRLSVGDVPATLMALEPTKFVSGFAYTLATALYLREHRRRIQDSYANLEPVNLRWLLVLGAIAAVIWTLALVAGTTGLLSGALGSAAENAVAVALALLVYVVGYMGLRQPEIFRFETAEFPVPVTPAAPASVPTHKEAPADPPRYERSGLSDADAARLEGQLRALMDSARPWTDSDLTLSDLARQLDTSPHKLSEVLNARVGQTFHDFVNGYRVREVQRRIAEGETRRRTMLAIAMDAGFASKSTFNQVFRKLTSQTPSGFQRASGF